MLDELPDSGDIMGLFHIFKRKEQEAGSIVAKIEQDCQQEVTIESEVSDTNLSKCHLQEQSPLFSLPSELRNAIFEFATLPYDNPGYAYLDTDLYYRPGYTAKQQHHTALLLTCRRAWLEANSLPMLQAEHCFWFKDNEWRPAWLQWTEMTEEVRFQNFIDNLTPLGRRNLAHIHLFAQMHWIEIYLPSVIRILSDRGLCVPKTFTLTIRHFDWFGWENSRVLLMNDAYLRFLLESLTTLGVGTFQLELETIKPKVDQLLPIVARLQGFKVISADAAPTSSSEAVQKSSAQLVLQDKQDEYAWSGPAIAPRPNIYHYGAARTLDYHVIMLTWKRAGDAIWTDVRSATENTRRVPVSSRHPIASSRTVGGPIKVEYARPERQQRWMKQIEYNRAQRERRWMKQSSLLKFGRILVSGRETQ